MIRCAWFLTDLRVGGAERLPLILLPRMPGVTGTLVLMKDEVALNIPPGISVTRLMPAGARLRASLGTLAAPALRAAGAADVVIGGMEGAPVVIAALAARLCGRPLVSVIPTDLGRYHRRLRFGALEWMLLKWALRSSAAVITASDDGRDSLIALGVRPDRVHVVPNPFSPWAGSLGERRVDLPPEPRVVTVARLEPIKGVDVALEAAGRLGDVPFAWDIVGSGPDEATLRRRAGELALDGRVRFLGFVDDLAPVLERSDVFLLASRVEGVPIAMLEAMAAGLAIVATRSGTGVVEALKDDAGVLVPPDDPGALAEALRAVLSDAPRLRALGAAARARARAYGPDAIAGRYAALVRRVAGRD